MPKTKIPDIANVANPDGSPNWDNIFAGLFLCKVQENEGHYKFQVTHASQHEHGKAGAADLDLRIRRTPVKDTPPE